MCALQGALPSRQTLRPGAPLSDRNAKTILKNNKYRGVRGVPDTVTTVSLGALSPCTPAGD